MFSNWLGLLHNTQKEASEKNSLLAHSPSASYNSIENDALVNQVTCLLQQNNALKAYKVIRVALESAEKMIQAVSNKNETISINELETLIQSFATVKELLVKEYTVLGYALYGKPGIITAVENIIFGLNSITKLLKNAEPPKTASTLSYQKS